MKAYITKEGALRHNVLIGTEIEFDENDLNHLGCLDTVYAENTLYNVSVYPFCVERDASAIVEASYVESK